jgi:protein phosphatase PTC2/3
MGEEATRGELEKPCEKIEKLRVYLGPHTCASRCESPFSSLHCGFRSDHGTEPSSSCRSVDVENQDRAAVCCTADRAVFLGVFDGHGEHGGGVSSFVSECLAGLFGGCTSTSAGDHADIMLRFSECNELLRRSAVPSDYSGTTAIVALLASGHLRVACVGDSRCVLGSSLPAIPMVARRWPCRRRQPRWFATELSEDQKASLASERARLISCGGHVWGAEGRAERVWARDASTGEFFGGLVMSRALGHHSLEPAGVIAQPVVVERSLTASDRCLILASDGVWDMLSSTEAVALCERHCPDSTAACRAIIRLTKTRCAATSAGQGRDDTSAIVVYLPLVVP